MNKVKDIFTSVFEVMVFLLIQGSLILLIYWLVSGNYPLWLYGWAWSVPESEGWLFAAIGTVITVFLTGLLVADIVKAVRAGKERTRMNRRISVR